jgi:glutaredoxin
MIKASQTIVTLVALSLAIVACSGPKEQKKGIVNSKPQISIIVYGDATCDHCVDLMAQLDSHNVKYTFHDVQRTQALANEMIVKLQAKNYRGNISLPVIDVGGELLVSPSLEEVLAVMK